MSRLLLLFATICLLTFGAAEQGSAAGSAAAQAEAAGGGPPVPDKIGQLLDLVNDPDVRAYLAQRRGKAEAARPVDGRAETMAGTLGDELQGVRNHVMALAKAAPRLPEEFQRARSMLAAALGPQELLSLALFFAAFVALGFGGEWLFRRLTRRFSVWLLGLELGTVQERIWAVFARLAYGLGLIASYGLGSIGALLLFDWSPLLKEILLGYLLASLAIRLSTVVGRFVLAPGAERFRVLPMPTQAATFLYRRLVLLVVFVALGWQTINMLGPFGFAFISRELTGYALGIVLLVVALETVWRFPGTTRLAPETAVDRGSQGDRRHWKRLAGRLGLSVVLLTLWAFWVARADTAFWVVSFAIGLPTIILLAERSIRHILRPVGAAEEAAERRLEVVFFERGLRTVLIVGGVLLLARLLGVDFVFLTMQDTLTTRVMRGVLGVVIIVLVADFLWHVIAVLIDRKLAANLGVAAVADDTGHAARLQTLLPILKNVLLAVLVVIAAMMMLAAIGVEIGPLIASAGVVGVAIGFGAQTLVRDIISGIFYLIDDAFRIGEYIQSGTYKGTVESFSLRSVKLRHQRGALYTVPFGVLGAVQNQSRDWVVDKITINVPYETDLERVRKLVKRIGETLAEDPELGPEIIKPIKMQGVAQFGDYAIQIQTKMMTKPGDVQFTARRRALIMIKQAFEANNIGFALPMVHVSGEGANAAAAQKGLALVQGSKVDAV